MKTISIEIVDTMFIINDILNEDKEYDAKLENYKILADEFQNSFNIEDYKKGKYQCVEEFLDIKGLIK